MDIDKIIARHFAGESSTEEEVVLKAWLEDNKNNQEDFQQLKAFWELGKSDIQESKMANWNRLKEHIHSNTIHDQPFINSKPDRVISFSFLYKVAASILILFVFYFGYQEFIKENAKEKNVALQVETIVKQNPAGRKSTIKLPDGSIVRLNSESQISFPSKFIGEKREITLSGEAFLEVAHDANRPFIVKTGNLETIVLGTSFNISAYPSLQTQKIALLTGKVQVLDVEKNMEIMLAPGEMVTTATKGLVKSAFDYDTEFGWKDGKLVLNKADNKEIFERLEKWFGYKIIPEKRISQELYTSTFSNESLEEVLMIIGETKGFDFEIKKEEKKVIIK